MFGVVQVTSIFVSFVSLFFSVLHFNQLEAKAMTVKSAGKVLLGILFFLLTIVFRAVGLALILCFLGWWASIILFLMFFSTVLTALCIGDNILRATVYGIWSFLVPVGYARDPTNLTCACYKVIFESWFLVEVQTWSCIDLLYF